MEYKLFKIINKRTPKNKLLRKFISGFFMWIWTFIFLIPLPFSVPTWILMFILWLIIKVKSPQNLKYLIKLKKSLIYLFKNIKNKKKIKQKIKDIKRLYKKLG